MRSNIMTNLERIRKIPRLAFTDLEKITQEVTFIGSLLINPAQALMNRSYNLHKVDLSEGTYFAADAKTANKSCNSGGRGNLRYLFDASTKAISAIAEHTSRGDYRILQRVN